MLFFPLVIYSALLGKLLDCIILMMFSLFIFLQFHKRMPEGISAENLVNNIMETLSDSVSKHKSGSFFEDEKAKSVSSQLNRLFGREKPVHHLLGGGKCKSTFFCVFCSVLVYMDSCSHLQCLYIILFFNWVCSR